MADRTDEFLEQLSTFRNMGFTGETVLQWKQGRVMEMGVNQKIRPTDNTAVRSAVLLQPNGTGSVLDSGAG